MTAEKQKDADTEKWGSTPESHAKTHSGREKPGLGGSGEYYRIEVRPKTQFETFRYHDVGEPGHIQRLAGQRENGTWDDQAWLISKKDAHIEKNFLVGDTKEAKDVIDTYGPAHLVEANIFMGHVRKNIPEGEKPTEAQQKAREENIKKAQASRSR